MKKFTSLILLVGLIFSGTAFSQEAPTRPGGPGGPGPARTPNRPPVPRVIKNNEQFQAWAADFKTAREAFSTKLQAMRASLQAASAAEKDGIRIQIREQMKLHRQEQIAFRKKVRGLMKDVREASAGGTAKTGE